MNVKKPPANRSHDQHKNSEDVKERHEVVAAAWSGPLPHPSTLAAFDKVVENGAERIMSAWEKETQHRHKMESRDLWLVGVDAIIGKLFAFLFVLSCLVLCGFAIWMGSDIVAALLGGGVMASVVWAFVRVNRPK